MRLESSLRSVSRRSLVWISHLRHDSAMKAFVGLPNGVVETCSHTSPNTNTFHRNLGVFSNHLIQSINQLFMVFPFEPSPL